MQRENISFSHKDGLVEGVYVGAGNNLPLVIIVNGHNGFYNYGMFPHIQQKLAEYNIASYSFNFSHGGINGDGDYFEDLEKYEKNCMRFELEDTMCVLQNFGAENFKIHTKIFLLAHSLGGVPAVFAAAQAQAQNINITGLILVSTVKQLDFWPKEMIDEWKRDKVYFKKNNRTKQLLPQGEEFLNEILQSDTTWNVETEIKKLQQPLLILHGENDEAIPLEHSLTKFEWAKKNNDSTSLKIIKGATHTFNTKHPFEEVSTQLEQMIAEAITFIHSLS